MKKHLSFLVMLIALLSSSGSLFAQGSGATIAIDESRCVATGVITVTGAQGTGPFTYDFTTYPTDYAYTGASASNVISALNPGNYTLRILDQSDGSFTDYPLTVPGSYIEPNYNITPTAVTGCYNGTNGSISGTIIDGRAPFSYEIMAGPMGVGTTNSTGTFTNLGPGTYTLRGYDSCGNFQTRQATIDNFYWDVTGNASTKTGCGQYTLDAMTLNNTVPGVQYTVKNGSTILAGPSSTLPLAFSNADNTIGSVTVCATDACGTEICKPLNAPADWSITFSNTTYPSCNTFSVNSINISGSPIGPLEYGFVRNVGDTVWSSTVPFTFGPQITPGYFFGLAIVKDGCGVVKITPNVWDRFMLFWGDWTNFTSTSCTESSITAAPNWSYIAPVTYSLNGGTSQSTGTFTNLIDGAYTITMTDACGATKTISAPIGHDWQISGGAQNNCGTGVIENYMTQLYRMKAPIVYEQYDATYSTLISTKTVTTSSNNPGWGPTDRQSYVYFNNALANETYNYIATDDCGRKDTLTIVNPAVAHQLNTITASVTPLCVNKGNITVNVISDMPSWNPSIISVWNINTPGTLLVNEQNISVPTGSVTYTDYTPGTYVISVHPQNCATELAYDTVTIDPYKLPKLRKSIAYPCNGTDVSVVGSGKFGIKPYTYEIVSTTPTNSPVPPQASNIFTLNGTYSLVTMRLVDACGNTSLQNIAVRQPAPLPIKTVFKLPSCNMTSLTLYVDSLLTGATYEWKNPAGTVIGTGPEVTVPTITTADTGTYTCRTIIAGTCFDQITQFKLRAKDFGCYAQLGNYVWNDVNKDGVQDANEVGVAGVTVTLYDASNNIVATTVTDAYGKYLFTQLNPGDYHVGFALPSNYVFTSKDAGTGTDATDSDPDLITGMTGVYTLVAGDSNMTVDAGIYLPTTTTASLGNYVWNDLNKDGIQNATELGISGVTVTLYDGAGNPVATTVTDASGHYYFSDLTPGIPYQVGFSQPIGYVFSPSNVGNDATDSDADPLTGLTSTVILAPGENNLTIDAGLYAQDPTKASLGNYVWYDNNQDGIQNPNEGGVAGVTVTLYAADGTTIIGTRTTDEFGYYIFNDLTPGDYVVGFTDYPTGYVTSPQNVGNDATDSDPNATTGKTAVINLSAGERDLTVDAGIYNASAPIGALGNKVWFDRDNDGVQDATENGVPGVTVILYAADGTTVLDQTTTDQNGNYIFNNLPAGTYIVGFSNLPLNYGFTNSDLGGNDATDSDPNRTTGKTGPIVLGTAEVNLTVDAGIVEINGRTGTASLGDVVWLDANQDGIQDPTELGVPGVTVTLYDAVTNAVIATKVTDGLGNYIFTGLGEGSYVVGFSNIPAGYTFTNAYQGTDGELDANADAASGGLTEVITLAEGEDNLTIDAGIYPAPNLASLGNYVWNDLNQDGIQDADEPGVSGVTVTLYTSAGVAVGVTSTDANGAYQFTGLTPGTYYVEFTNLPAGFDFTDPNANGNGSDDLDSDADPITGETPWVALVAGQNYPDLDAGIFTEKAGLGNYVWNDYNNDGIQDANEPGIAGITVTLYAADGVTPISTAITDADGKYTFVNLEPGSYVVGFSGIPAGSTFSPQGIGTDANNSDANQATGKTGVITLAAGDYNPNVDAGIHTPQGAGLGNYVWLDVNKDGIQDANEPGVAGITVTLYNAAGVAIQTAITDQNGFYSFPNLAPGTYSVGFSTIPNNRAFTLPTAGGNTALDNNVTTITGSLNNNLAGTTPQVTIVAGEYNPTIDAGLVSEFPLGVDKLEASASLTGTVSTVNWITLNEKDVRNFDVERSIDLVNFTRVSVKEAKGNTNGVTTYSIKDDVSSIMDQAVIYYRVVSNDQDGLKTNSNVVAVRTSVNADPIQVYPSPFTEKFNIEYVSTEASELSVIVTDAAGRIVASSENKLVEGMNIIEIGNLSGLAKGTYFVKIKELNSDEQFVKKLLKK